MLTMCNNKINDFKYSTRTMQKTIFFAKIIIVKKKKNTYTDVQKFYIFR